MHFCTSVWKCYFKFSPDTANDFRKISPVIKNSDFLKRNFSAADFIISGAKIPVQKVTFFITGEVLLK